jgi:predicted aspartyl protease
VTSHSVVSSRFPYLPIRVTVGGLTFDGEALLDTGFGGGVMLPSRYMPDDDPDFGYVDWVLADHSTLRAPSYKGTVEIDGFQPFQTSVGSLGDTVLVGVQVIRRFYVLLDHGDRIVVSQ